MATRFAKLLFAFALLVVDTGLVAQTTAAETCYMGCEPSTRRNLDWCTFTDGMGGLARRSNVDTDSLTAGMLDACDRYAVAHTNSNYTTTFAVCKPVLRVPFISSGGLDASLPVEGRAVVVRNSDGFATSVPGPWWLTSCGCTDRLNGNLAKVGVDAKCYCPVGYIFDEAQGGCVQFFDRFHDKPEACSANPGFGHPIFPLTGNKRYVLRLFNWGGEPVNLVYDSRRATPSSRSEARLNMPSPASAGKLWETSLHRALYSRSGPLTVVLASRGQHSWATFVQSAVGSASYKSDAERKDQLLRAPFGWTYLDAESRAVESYGFDGLLASSSYSSGRRLRYTYSTASTPVAIAPRPGLLLQIEDQAGRTVLFTYRETTYLDVPPVIATLTDSGGRVYALDHDASGNLTKVTWPDLSSTEFLYENATFGWALTGVRDERLARTATFGYDMDGRATFTERAGGVGRFAASWSIAPSWQVVDTYDAALNIFWRDHTWAAPSGVKVNTPSGQWISIQSQSVLGMPRLTEQTQPAGSGCGPSMRTQTHDVNANIVSQDDFGGNRVCRAFDMSRNLELVRVEGLPGGDAGVDCSSVLSSAGAMPAGSRKVSTAWHKDWPLETQIAEPGRRTTFVFNGQPDPFAGGASARCAPSAALALVCRRVEQATNDPDGALGLTAPLQTGVAARQESWTYDEYGHVLTYDGPRSDVADISLNEYYADTAFTGADPYAVGHTRGDLKQTTSPAGHVTRYTLYNKLGQLLEMVDPNGIVTSHTYDLRQRLTSTTVGGQTTTFAYWPNGLIQRITKPNGSWVHYEHDDAHRLVKVSDNLGNSVGYTLDNLGNRIAEDVRDPANVLRRQLTRSIDALGRVQLVTGRE